MMRQLPVIGSAVSQAPSPETAAERPKAGAWSDWVGMVASIGCAIHCAAMPFVIAYLPAMGLSFLADESFHKWMALACFAIATTAFIPGLRRHRRLAPVLVGSIGLVMITTAAFGFAGDCCAACASESTPVDTVDTEQLNAACCPLCASENSSVCAEPSDLATTESQIAPTQTIAASSRWFALFVPWLTPLGGVVLVCAHLLNRRYGCLCGCCSDEVPETA